MQCTQTSKKPTKMSLFFLSWALFMLAVWCYTRSALVICIKLVLNVTVLFLCPSNVYVIVQFHCVFFLSCIIVRILPSRLELKILLLYIYVCIRMRSSESRNFRNYVYIMCKSVQTING